MNQAASQTELLQATPSAPFIHVAGDLIVRIDSNPLHSLARMLATPLADGLATAAARSTRESTPGPSIIVRDEDAPWKIMADGKRVDARESVTDHVALLFPATDWMVAVGALSNVGQPLDSQQDVEAAAKALTLLGYDDWALAPDKVYERHVIDRRYHEPAVDKNLYPNLPLSDWYWTSTIAPWSAESAFSVFLHYGGVGSNHRFYSGFGLACRRARQ
ncbi:MAG: hypothetical protein ABS82_01180 [Rhodanobacter sp. SCN 67-45]|nr:MAG: hypothetical protein ABS82_01180 [Rhodanobacter sp. SCN 67-45]